MENKENRMSKLENKTDLNVEISGISMKADGSTHDVNDTIEHANACVVVCGVGKGMEIHIEGGFDFPFVVAMLHRLREGFGEGIFDRAMELLMLGKLTGAFDYLKDEQEEQENG